MPDDGPTIDGHKNAGRAQMSISGDLAASFCLDGQPHRREDGSDEKAAPVVPDDCHTVGAEEICGC